MHHPLLLEIPCHLAHLDHAGLVIGGVIGLARAPGRRSAVGKSLRPDAPQQVLGVCRLAEARNIVHDVGLLVVILARLPRARAGVSARTVGPSPDRSSLGLPSEHQLGQC